MAFGFLFAVSKFNVGDRMHVFLKMWSQVTRGAIMADMLAMAYVDAGLVVTYQTMLPHWPF